MAPRPPKSSSPLWRVINAGSRLNIAVYRATGGRFGGRMGKAPILILHHVGAKSGTHRVTPVLYLEDGRKLVVVASKGGTDKHPAWFHNLMANPDTTVEVGRDKRRVHARRASDEERTRLWPRLTEMYPPYAEYEQFAANHRKIPVVVLEPAA
jgi:deazaflavin-dependent oxidoreductase (nitroreductase family)